jgi:hypothetical protein
MQNSPRVLRLGLLTAFALGACDADGVTPPTSTDAGTGGSVCGTSANPGILKVAGLSPAIGSTVENQGIAHGFVVENAPAVYVNFPLKYGPTHTVGLSTPSNPKIQATESGSNVIYQITVAAWSRAPGHVEIVAPDEYSTSKGCFWVFPSPLFSYDIVPVLDGGAGETQSAMDGRVSPVDSPQGIPGALDAASVDDVPLASDVTATAEVTAAPDGGIPVEVDAAIDNASSVDASLD